MAHAVVAVLVLLVVIAIVQLHNRPSSRHEFVFSAVAWLALQTSVAVDVNSAPPRPKKFTSLSPLQRF